MYIDNGTAVPNAPPNVIAVSEDGVNWTYINKGGVSVRQFFQAGAGTQAGKYPFTNKTIIKLYSPDGMILVEFEAQSVPATGVGGHANWQAGDKPALEIATNEIAGWL